MPQKVMCSSCGTILYHGVELESPSETIARLAGSCPHCSKKLGFNISKIKIGSADLG